MPVNITVLYSAATRGLQYCLCYQRLVLSRGTVIHIPLNKPKLSTFPNLVGFDSRIRAARCERGDNTLLRPPREVQSNLL